MSLQSRRGGGELMKRRPRGGDPTGREALSSPDVLGLCREYSSFSGKEINLGECGVNTTEVTGLFPRGPVTHHEKQKGLWVWMRSENG